MYAVKTNNLLDSLDVSQNYNLVGLHCSNNNLTELPILPDSLKYLDCSCNELTELSKIPESLEYLDCSFNNLPYEITINNFKEHNTLIKRKQILSKICT